VLTAAHCLDSTRPADFAVTFPDGERRGAVTVVPYTAESGVRQGAPVDDLAVVQLDRPADATPLALPADAGTAAVTATPVLELGYGATSPGGAPSPEGELRRAGQVLTGTPTGSGRGALLLQGVPQGLGGIPGGSCAAGDSGGPLVAVASPPVLLGVVSSAVAGTSACWSSRVDAGPYRTWLDGVMAQPGARFGDAATEAAQADGEGTPGTPGTAPSTLPSGASAAAAAPPLPAVLATIPQPAPAAPTGLTAAELGPLADTAPGRLAPGTAVTTPSPPPGPAPVVVYTR
jgi:secreted trypsin-like serine protease